MSQWNLISDYIPHSPWIQRDYMWLTWIMKLRLFCWHVSNLLCHICELINTAAYQSVSLCHIAQVRPSEQVLSTSNQIGRFWPSLPPKAKATPRWNEDSNWLGNVYVAGLKHEYKFKKLTNNLIIDSPVVRTVCSAFSGPSLTEKHTLIWTCT